ncbi:MAG: hypothetical protein HQL32_15955, partial [Planctomycetes bacterium]|nr:hypothetical protein [Planctomycetota bacterium]
KSVKQTELITQGKGDELMELMEKKQSLIEKLELSSSQFIEEKVLLEKTPMGEFSTIDEELDQVLMAIEEVLKRLVERESEDMEVLSSLQKDHNEQMRHLGSGRDMAKAYLKPKQGSSLSKKV